MKIGINASFLRKSTSGIGQVSLNFLKELAKIETKHQFIIYLEEDLPEDFLVPSNWKVEVFLPLWKRDDLIRKILWEKCLLPKKIQSNKCDLFFSLYQCPTILKGKTKHIILVHDIIPRLFPEYLNNFRKKIYQVLIEKATKKADHILSVSQRTEKDLIQNFKIPGNKITINYPDIDPIYKKELSQEKTVRVLKKYDLAPGYILGGGGLEKRKNIDGLILAYARLCKQNKQENFLNNIPPLAIIGKLAPKLSPLITDAEKLVKELNLTEKVKLLGFVPQSDMPALYNQASLFAYPSFYEGFGLPILEAMNQNTPVITGKNSSLPEVGRDAVLYCRPENTEELSYVIKKVLIQKALRETLSQRGSRRAKEFSWKRFVNKFLNLAEQL